MKKVFTFLCLCKLSFFANAQQPYPAAPAASGNINTIEYFINARQDFGAGTSLTGFTASPNVIAFVANVNLSGLPQGFHRIYFRSKDATGKWSLTQDNFFDNYNAPLYNTAPPAPVQIT